MSSVRTLINRSTRVILLTSLLLSMSFFTQTTFAQSAQPQWSKQDILNRLGIQRPSATNLTELSLEVAKQIHTNGLPAGTRVPQSPNAGGIATDLNGKDAMSSAIMTTLNSSASTNFRDVMLMADADGREDLVADHSALLTNQASSSLPAGWVLTRTAVSEHSFANGFNSSVYYFGDSLGNVTVGVDSTGSGVIDNVPLTPAKEPLVINLPTVLNAFGTLNSADQIVITGLAVNPVADLTSFSNVNGSFASFAGKIGEILYVSYWDTGGGLRELFTGQLVKSGVLAFPIADIVSPVAAPPGILSPLNFPVTVGGSFGVFFSTFDNLAGLAVDDDGSVYFQQVDLTNFTGANIVKMTSVDMPGTGGFQDRSLATNGFAVVSTLNPINGLYPNISGPAKQVTRVTNYSGTSSTFGNIVTLAAGPNNILYAGLARSFVATDPVDIQNTEGPFANPAALGSTPSMVISFADTSGGFDSCTVSGTVTTGTLPIADGFADVAQAGMPLQPGVNNFRAFVLGNGPDVRGFMVGATAANTLQMDFQVDASIYSGLTVDEESKVYLISGATPVNVGLNPSPTRSEILIFPDEQPFDRRADFIDLRGDQIPNPNSVAATPGDGKSDRFDHIYYQAPLDQLSLTPVGLSGLSRGFLLYLNRTRDNLTVFTNLPNGTPQGDDMASGPLNFEDFDAGHQIAGGDDQVFPFRGDDSDGGGSPAIAGPLNGGFEYTFRKYDTGTSSLVATAWNAFYLNSNGNLTFGAGDPTKVPTAATFLTGLPRVAGAWANLNPGSNWQNNDHNTFPVQALGFANINHFIVRWINTPTFGYESCGSSNTFAISLYDDGTGVDENANQPLNPANPIGNNAVPFDLQEGPTDLRYFNDPVNKVISATNPRTDGSGNLCLTYGRMDLLGSLAASDQVLVGMTPGLLPDGTSPGINLSVAALANDVPFPNPQGIAMGSAIPASPYELFSTGAPAGATAAVPAFDLRQEGNDPASSTPVNQPDPNRGQVCFHNLDSQSIVFNALPDRPLSMLPFTVAATASSGLAVTFTASGTCSATGPTGSILTASGLGLCTVTAHQNGNATIGAAPQVPRTFMIVNGLFLPFTHN